MDIQKILQHYDQMFGQNSLEEIENFLVYYINEAKQKGEIGVVFTLLNEMIGFCRDTTQEEKGLKYCEELKEVLSLLNIDGSMEYGTCLLNIANAYRAFGLYQESLDYFRKTESIYKKYLDKYDFGWANLYNNWGLLYQETHDYNQSVEILSKALAVVDVYDYAIIPQAVTRSNLAASLIQMQNQGAYEQAFQYLKQALKIYEDDGGRDFHYAAALVCMGDAYNYVKKYDKARNYYYKGLKELEKHVGKNDNYLRVLEKYNYMNELLDRDLKWKSNLEKSRVFYEFYGKPMIHEKFRDYEDRIAVGMVGEGSDCYGFDDEISSDHDYDIGFCMWLTDEDYKKIGKSLQEEYDRLMDIHSSKENHSLLKQRRGVFSINGFYNHLLETSCNYEIQNQIDFSHILDYQLSLATNGLVFNDPLGIFTFVRRQLLNDYPNELWKRKLAQKIHDFSQYAQSNYSRMMAREDQISASICQLKAVETAMDLVYLLEHVYAPYYKWKRKGIENLALGQRIIPLLEKIVNLPNQQEAWKDIKYDSSLVNQKDQCVVLFDQIAKIFLDELKKQGIVQGNELFLEVYINQILGVKKMNFVDKIIELEWQQFDKVENEGGRATCQDDYSTFVIMRKSQYLTWNEQLLESYYNDLVESQKKGWNLITEKYARMMKTTCPDKYAQLEKSLPKISKQRQDIQEEIIKIQVAWMEDFAKHYPKMAGNARSIRTISDNENNTSYETYLRGEMSTYSEETLLLYGQFIISLVNQDRNLAYEIMLNTAHLYGYQTLDDAENKI